MRTKLSIPYNSPPGHVDDPYRISETKRAVETKRQSGVLVVSKGDEHVIPNGNVFQEADVERRKEPK